MKTYIFLSKEGSTQAPNEKTEVNNMQVIGIIDEVENENQALKKLLQENAWIWDSGFNVGEFIAYEILSS